MATTARRSTSVGAFQQQQRGEMEALGDRDVSDHDVAAFDPLTGRIVAATEHAAQVMAQADRTVSVAAELAALNVEASADTPLGEIVGRVRLAAGRAKIEAGEPEIRAEAERIWTSFGGVAERYERRRQVETGVADPLSGRELATRIVEGEAARIAAKNGIPATAEDIRVAAEVIVATLKPVEPKPEDRRTGRASGAHEYDVTPDGTVRDWRQYAPRRDADTDIDASPDDATADGPRFSGAGANGDGLAQERVRDRGGKGRRLKVPGEAAFGDEEFIVSKPLAERAAILIDRHPEYFEHLGQMQVAYLWKKSGGKSKGRAVFGKTTKPTGLLKLFSESTFVIWLASDHCRAAYYEDQEIEELLFHELLHTGEAEPDEETGRGGGPQMQPHQLEIFHAEIEVYGLESAILREAAPLFRAAVRQERDRRSDQEVAAVDDALAADPNGLSPDGETLDDLPTDEEIDASLAGARGDA